jgi:hypothetical protein
LPAGSDEFQLLCPAAGCMGRPGARSPHPALPWASLDAVPVSSDQATVVKVVSTPGPGCIVGFRRLRTSPTHAGTLTSRSCLY